ncbi:MAG: hypothetical protein V1922_01360 [bacterium]
MLYFQKNKILIYTTWIVALLTREYFWIYYIIFGFIDRKKIISKINNILWYFLLLLIPLFWTLYTKQSVIIGFNSNTASITIPIILQRANRLILITQNEGLIPSTIAVMIVSILLLKDLIYKKYKISLFEKNYLLFGFFSLIIIYLYIIVKDPWSATPYNPRMLFPLIILLPAYYLISFKYVLTKPNLIKYFLIMTLFFSLLIHIHFPPVNNLKAKRSPFFRDINTMLTLAKKTDKNIPLKIGVVGIDYWNEYVLLFVGPFLYENAEYLTDDSKISDYQLLVTNAKSTYHGFEKCKTVHIGKVTSFNILCRKQ